MMRCRKQAEKFGTEILTEDVESVEFSAHINNRKITITIDDKDEIARIVETIKLQLWKPCESIMLWKVTFKKKDTQIVAGISADRFVIIHGKNYRYYKMPEKFWKLFEQYKNQP